MNAELDTVTPIGDVTPIGEVTPRRRVRIRGRVRSLRVRPWADSPTLEVVLVDDTGGISAVFLARRRLGGVRPGTVMTVDGVAGSHQHRLAILNPEYVLEG